MTNSKSIRCLRIARVDGKYDDAASRMRLELEEDKLNFDLVLEFNYLHSHLILTIRI